MGFFSKLFGGGSSGGTYTHLSYRASVDKDTSPIVLYYDSPSTMLVDEINLLVQSAGNRTIGAYCVVIDDASNKQIGRKVVFTPPTTVSAVVVSGLAASMQRGRRYRFEIGHIDDDINALTVPPTQVVTMKNIIQIRGYEVTDPIWRVPSSVAGKYLSIGGWQSYKGNGEFTRTLDVGVPASQLKQDGIFHFSDIVPAGTNIQADLYYTDDSLIADEPSLANWGLFMGGVPDGKRLPKHRYWRVVFTLTANKTLDFTPEIADFSIEYRPEPKTFGTVIDTDRSQNQGFFVKATLPWLAQSSLRMRNRGFKNLSSFNFQSTKVNPRFQVSIDGGFSAVIAEDKDSDDVFARNLSNKVCKVRVGFRGVKSKIAMYSGRVSDVTFNRGAFSLTAADHFTEFKKKIPASKAALTWSNSVNYNTGDKAVFFGALYTALQANIGAQPDVSPADWQATGGAWADIIYDETTHPFGTKWHLADIALDIIKNHINIHTSKIDEQSFEDIKLRFPSRIGTLIIRKPVSADKVIAEISWFLESHVIQSGNKITLVAEPSISSGMDVITISNRDIKSGTLTYKAGWSNLRNEAIILTAYDNNPSQTSDHFNDGEVVVDADSVQEFDIVSVDVFKDRFNIDPSELQLRAATYVNKWKRGRALVQFDTTTRHLDLGVLSTVKIESDQLPGFRKGAFTGIVVDKDINWLNQTIRIKILEVK